MCLQPLSLKSLHAQACEMEHSLSDEAERAICHMLEHPDTCPDDHLIPACDFDFANCDDCLNDHSDIEDIGIRNFNLLSISQLSANEEGEILFIRGGDASMANAINLGLTIGSKITIADADDSNYFNVYLEDSLIQISRDMANNIFLKTF